MTTPTDETIPAEPIPFIDVNVHQIALQALSISTKEIDHSVDVLAECDDPIPDPFTLDDSSKSGTELIGSAIRTSPDLDTPTDGQLTLVDVNILRKFEQNELPNSAETLAKTETEDLSEIIEEGVRSDGSDSGLASDGYIAEVRPQISEIIRSCLKRRSSESNPKKVKRTIKFDRVNVFYFKRLQGNSGVPSEGGCSLGMARNHMYHRTFLLAEHADDPNTEDKSSQNSFLKSVSVRQRTVMLKTAGVLKIDSKEKDECRLIRTSREIYGCNCRGSCDPDTCDCSQSGIQSHVDESYFPRGCGCTRNGCGNVAGRVEFDPERVRIHFVRTLALGTE